MNGPSVLVRSFLSPIEERMGLQLSGQLAQIQATLSDSLTEGEAWSNTSRLWHEKVVDKNPGLGLPYYHLAKLAYPCSMEQLSLYARSFTCVAPSEVAREDIMTMFNHILSTRPRLSWEERFIRAHAMIFTDQTYDPKEFSMLISMLGKDDMAGVKAMDRFSQFGVSAAISNVAALFEYGTPASGVKARLRLAYEKGQLITMTNDESLDDLGHPSAPEEKVARSSKIASKTLDIWLRSGRDSTTHPLIHIYMVFISSLIVVQQSWKSFEEESTWRIIETDLPWRAICLFLNIVTEKLQSGLNIGESFSQSSEENNEKERPGPLPESLALHGPLPEDFAIRGQTYSTWYFPDNWFRTNVVDSDERKFEMPFVVDLRMKRILWLGHSIASVRRTL